MSQALADKINHKIMELMKQSWAMTSCCSPACWYVLAAALRPMSLLMQQLKPHSWVCVCLDIVPLPLFLIQQQEAQHRQHSKHQNCLRLLHRNTWERKAKISHPSWVFLSLPTQPITQPAAQRSQSLALHSSAVIIGFRGTRWHKMTHLLAVFLLCSFWLDWETWEGNIIQCILWHQV